MNLELVVTNIGFIFALIVSLGLGILVFIRRPKEGALINIVFFLQSIAFAVWQASYVIGINLTDPLMSRFAFMFNLSTLLVVVMNAQTVLLMTGRYASRKVSIAVLYIISIGFMIFYILYPDALLLPSAPLQYLPNFFVPGSLYWIQDTYFLIVFLYSCCHMLVAFYKADRRTRNRIKYFIVAYIYAFMVGLIPDLLLYGIHIDPLPVSLIGLWGIPMAYAILKYEVFDLNILAKRAFGYALTVGGITLFILMIGYANDTAVQMIPDFPRWLLPLLSAVLAMFAGLFVWKKMKETDFLKFQFVDVVTHKFRTPLTHIKWSTEILKADPQPADRDEALANIEEASVRLFEMTNTLIGLSSSDHSQYLYTYTPENIGDLVSEALAVLDAQVRNKNITIEKHIPENLPHIFVDRKRMQFVIQMIIENAVLYSRAGSPVIIQAEQVKTFLILSVKDSGLGISKDDMSRLFSRFFRGTNASETHTEGLGIGLYVSRDIMKRHGGELWATSLGIDKGSTFFVKIPLER